MTPPSTPPRWRKLSWVGLLYFAEGTPFGFINDAVPLWLESAGASIKSVGLFAGLEAPWSWKLAWAPLVDWFGTRRRWMVLALSLESLLLAAAAWCGASNPTLLALVLLAYVTASATADIAVDAYTIELTEKGEEGPVNSVRVALYRASWLLAGGVTVALAPTLGWTKVVLGVAALMLLIAIAVLMAPRVASDARVRQRGSFKSIARGWWTTLSAWFRLEGALALALCALLYKLPDSSMGPMPRLFWKHSGLSLEEIGWFLTPLNLACVVIGSITGGMAIPKLGVLRGLFWFGLAQASSNAVYAVVAAMGGTSERILFATGYENFTAGLGTAALLSLLMRMCGKEQAATEYALLSALFALVRFPAKMVSGVGVESLGYSGFFWLTTALAVPGLLSLFSVKLAQRIGEPPLARH
jgi:PAT family beta-lactamase induction signal transducer AmpG